VAGIGLAALHLVQMRPPGFPETIIGLRQQPHRFQGLAILLSSGIPTNPQETMPGYSMSVGFTHTDFRITLNDNNSFFLCVNLQADTCRVKMSSLAVARIERLHFPMAIIL
jgi:hypothetical protein